MNRAGARDLPLPDHPAPDHAALELVPAPAPSARQANRNPGDQPSSSAAPLPARLLYALWTLAILALFALHFPHLLADFPNHSPWMDYSKYTDEGWYANAAIRFHQTGHWYLHGGFNPAVALPVWPLLLAAVFHFTGVSLAGARAVGLIFFGLNLALTWLLVRSQAPRWAALLAVTLLASSPFLFAFSRLALLEPPLTCLLLLSWLLALRLPRTSARLQAAILFAIGLLACLMILTKTTAVFLLPSTLWLIARAQRSTLAAARAAAVAGLAGALPWSAYYFLFVRPHYFVDYWYFFSSNHWPRPHTLAGWAASFWYALHGTLWLSPTFCCAAVALLLLALLPAQGGIRLHPAPRRAHFARQPGLWRNPVVQASLLAAAGYVFFNAFRDSPQPRYYQTVIYPLVFVLTIGPADLFRRRRPLFRIGGAAAVGAIALVSIAGMLRIAGYLRHPEYTFLIAARGIARVIDAHPAQPRLLLSISGDDLRFITGVPALCDDYGPWTLTYRIHMYRPGWYAAWNDLDPGTLADLQTQYALEEVAEFPAFDDPDRNVLVLYRLDPLPAAQQTYSALVENALNARK